MLVNPAGAAVTPLRYRKIDHSCHSRRTGHEQESRVGAAIEPSGCRSDSRKLYSRRSEGWDNEKAAGVEGNVHISRVESYKDELAVAEEKRLPSSAKKDEIERQKQMVEDLYLQGTKEELKAFMQEMVNKFAKIYKSELRAERVRLVAMVCKMGSRWEELDEEDKSKDKAQRVTIQRVKERGGTRTAQRDREEVLKYTRKSKRLQSRMKKLGKSRGRLYLDKKCQIVSTANNHRSLHLNNSFFHTFFHTASLFISQVVYGS